MGKIILRNITVDGRPSDIRIEGSRIAAIRPHGEDFTVPEGFEVADCSGKVAVPGFVNAHTHAAMSLLRGIGEDMALKDWLDHIWAIESHLDAPFIYHSGKVAALEMIKTGTTAFNDMYWHSYMARKAADETGLGCLVSYTFLDNFDQKTAERQKEECLALTEAVGSWGERTKFAISVHSVYTVSEPLILWATEHARKRGLRIHIHVSETEREVQDCKAAHGGLSPVEYLDSLGVLGPDVIAAHTLWLSGKDVEILGSRGVSCVHNINSNLKLASGYNFLWKELTEAGANVCLGTDGCASSNNLDMLEAMKTCAITQKAWRKDPSALPLESLLKMATVNGGKALGLKTGRIEEGWDADIQIVDTDSTYFISPAPFLANFIYSAHSDSIVSLISGGEFVMRDRKVPGEEEIRRAGRECLSLIEKFR
ncbi:MAG: amidohydrolase [Bacteroidales bacterium]|nr:amidohydrolase [Bacteroidales bacterium]